MSDGQASSDALLDRFVNVFRGRSDVYGSSKGFCVKEPLSKAVFEKHLTSSNPRDHIGVYCMIGELCSWGCIDIDGKDFPSITPCENCEEVCDPPCVIDGVEYGPGVEWDWHRMLALAANLSKLLGVKDVPSYIERSKNGYHVWVFPEEPLVKAATMRRALMAACTALGYNPKEVNPKAEGPRAGTKGYGNFVRLPYGGSLVEGYEARERYFITELGTPFRQLRFALDYIDTFGRVPTATLESIAKLWTPPPVPDTEVDYEAGLDDEQVQNLLRIIDGKSFTIWKNGPLPGSDRSTTLARLAHLLSEQGLTATQAFAVLKSADSRWGKFQDRPEELGRMIERAYQ